MRIFAPSWVKFAQGLLLCILLAAPASAQRWIDAKTGQPVPSGPIVDIKAYPGGTSIFSKDLPPSGTGILPDSGDPNRAFDAASGRNFVRDPATCTWRDAATGKTVPSGPIVDIKAYPGGTSIFSKDLPPRGTGIFPDSGDPNRAFDPATGRNFVREKCPPPKPKTTPQQPQTSGQVGSALPVKLNGFGQRILDIHNGERAAVGAAPLGWNPQLAAGAIAYVQELARTGERVHAPREGRGDVRENLNQGTLGWNTDQMLRNWLDEKRNFTPGIFPDVCTGGWTQCGHYSQIIWPTTTDLGCGMASGSGYQWLVCRYSPGGNKDGKPVGQTSPTAAATSYRWIDVKTGKPVNSWIVLINDPNDYSKGVRHVQPSIGDPNRAYDPDSGRNFARENGQWIDVKTGRKVNSWIVLINDPNDYSKGVRHVQPSIGDPNRAYEPESGRNFAKVPVPARPATQPAREPQSRPEPDR